MVKIFQAGVAGAVPLLGWSRRAVGLENAKRSSPRGGEERFGSGAGYPSQTMSRTQSLERAALTQ